MRIIQEATNNSIKHSETDRLTVTTEQNEAGKQFLIKIIDYGKGFNNGQTSGGRGLTNMQYRAEQAGIVLTIDPTSKGTQVSLLFALQES